MKSSAKKVELASVDDLFSTEESRADAQRERVMPKCVREICTMIAPISRADGGSL